MATTNRYLVAFVASASILIAGGACGGVLGAGPEPAEPGAELWAMVVAFDTPMATDVEERLEQLVGDGIILANTHGTLGSRIHEAKQNLATLLDALDQGATIAAQGAVTLGILDRILEDLCPLWPFC